MRAPRTAVAASIVLLDVIAPAALATALLVFVTGGFELDFRLFAVRAGGIANPLWIAFTAAALRILMSGDSRADPLPWFGPFGRRLVTRHLGPGAERLRAVLAFRADAVIFALFALWSFDQALLTRVQVAGDGVGYYAYVRSVLLDGDIDFENEFRDHDPQQQWAGRRTKAGRITNPFAIGAPLLWTPFFIAGWGAAAFANRFGGEIPMHGYSEPFVFATAAGTWIIGLVGVILLYRLLLRFYSRPVALGAAIATTLASPLAFYLTFAPFFSHAHSLFVVALFLITVTATTAAASLPRWALLGAAAGLVAITRWQDAVFCIIPLLVLITATLEQRTAGRYRLFEALRSSFTRGVAFLGGFFVVSLPQLIVIERLYGSWFLIPQGKGFVGVFPSHLGESLFSWNHGLFSWSPLLLLATVGLALAGVSRRPLAVVLLVALGLQFYANGSVAQWWAGNAFGARRFASAIPLFAFGLAELLRRTAARPAMRRVLWLAIAGGIAWTQILSRLWLRHEIPHDRAIAPVEALMTWLGHLVSLDAVALLGEATLLEELLYRLSDLVGPRLPFLLFAVAAYLASHAYTRRVANQRPTTDA